MVSVARRSLCPADADITAEKVFPELPARFSCGRQDVVEAPGPAEVQGRETKALCR